MNPWALMLFQRIRTEYGKPLVISSAYRCPEHPDEASKAKAGRHSMGIAFDVRLPWGADRMELFRIAMKHGARRFGFANSFLHIDFDTTGATCWGYN